MFTEEEARRLAAILTDTVVQPIDPRLERIEKEIPRAPTPANIIMALQTLIELDDLELSDVKAHAGALRKLLAALERAETLSGKFDMTVAEAENFLRALAQGGNEEARKLLDAFDDPFVEP